MSRKFYCLTLFAVLVFALTGCQPTETVTEETVTNNAAPVPVETASVETAAVEPAADEMAVANTADVAALSAPPQDTPSVIAPAESDNSQPTEIVGQEAFDAFIQDNQVAIIDFTATWCGPCQKLAPHLEKMAVSYAAEGVKLGKVDVDQNREISTAAGIQGIPDVRIFVRGQQVAHTVGYNPIEILTNLDNAVKTAQESAE